MTKIEWTDATYNPIVGCAAVSPGCAHCYAAGVARRGMQPAHVGLVNQRGHWTGEVRLLHERLAEPLHWRKPRRVFVCSMSDLFHDDVPDDFIDRVFAVMALAPQHTFQVLTKRPDRMRKWFDPIGGVMRRDFVGVHAARGSSRMPPFDWPLFNVWLGVSCEDQQRADERIPLLLQTPAAVRFVSAEPLLGPVDLRLTAGKTCTCTGSCRGRAGLGIGWRCALDEGKRIDWVIVGGESGPGARPCNVAWIRSIVEQCRGASVPVFVKQLGGNNVVSHDVFDPPKPLRNGRFLRERVVRLPLRDRKGGNPDEWPADLRVREWPGVRPDAERPTRERADPEGR